MLFQFEEAIVMRIISGGVGAIIIFVIGIYIILWYTRKKEWDDSLLPAFIINITWLISGLPISILFFIMFGENFLVDLLELVISIIIGTIVVKFVYKKGFGESFVFVIIVELILFLIGILIGIGFILVFLLLGAML